MKRKLLMSVFLLLSLIIVLVGCSAEIVDSISKESISGESYTLQDSDTSVYPQLRIIFTPVSFVSNYGYTLDDDESNITAFVPEQVSSDRYSYTLSVSELEGVFNLYANQTDSDWKWVGSVDYFIDPSEFAPTVALQSRNGNEVQLKITSDFSLSDLCFRVISNNGEIIEDNLEADEDGIIEFTADEKDTYVKVAQKYNGSNGGDYHNFTEVPIYETTIALESVDGGFYISGLTGMGTLYRSYSSDLINAEEICAGLSDGYVSFSEGNFQSLDSGYFFVKGDNDEWSNSVYVEVPLIPLETTVNYKSIQLTFNFAPSATSTFSASAGSDSFTAIRSGDTVTISGLASDTIYENLRLVPNGDQSKAYTIERVTTKSFVGTYFWKGTVTATLGSDKTISYYIDVRKPAQGSTSPYYIYLSSKDDASGGSANLRVLPLIDTSIDTGYSFGQTVFVKAPGEYEYANDAYVANNGKWNASTIEPTAWRIISYTIENTDRITTVTSSDTSIVSNVETTSTYEFLEWENSDGEVEPVVRFINKGDGLAALGMYTNKNGNAETFEYTGVSDSNASYSFFLTKVGE